MTQALSCLERSGVKSPAVGPPPRAVHAPVTWGTHDHARRRRPLTHRSRSRPRPSAGPEPALRPRLRVPATTHGRRCGHLKLLHPHPARGRLRPPDPSPSGTLRERRGPPRDPGRGREQREIAAGWRRSMPGGGGRSPRAGSRPHSLRGFKPTRGDEGVACGWTLSRGDHRGPSGRPGPGLHDRPGCMITSVEQRTVRVQQGTHSDATRCKVRATPGAGTKVAQRVVTPSPSVQTVHRQGGGGDRPGCRQRDGAPHARRSTTAQTA